MYVIQNLHWFVLFIGILIFIHELGHFIVAKLCNVKVQKFSLGFGPKLFSIQKGETEYRVSVLPLGGYVKMLGELPGVEIPDEDAPRAFSARPLWQRSLIVIAGPFFNIALAWVAYTFLSFGTQSFLDTRVGIVIVDEPAWQAGLRPGDKIIQVNSQKIDEWNALREYISSRPQETVEIKYIRDRKIFQTQLTPRPEDETNLFNEIETRGRIGISPNYVKTLAGIVDSDSPAARAGIQTGDLITHVNNHEVNAWHELRKAIQALSADQSIRLRALRDEKEISFLVQPEPRLTEPAESIFSSADPKKAYIGLVSEESLVAEIEPNTPAARIGLQKGDRLIKLGVEKNNRRIERPIGVWTIDLLAFQGVDAASDFIVTFQRGQEIISKRLKLMEKEEKDELKTTHKRYVFGANNNMKTIAPYTYDRYVGIGEAAYMACSKVGQIAVLTVQGIAKLIQGSVPLKNVGGVGMLFVIAAKSAERGLAHFMDMLALISINLAFLNLLPIPVLDGGHLLMFGVEAVNRKPPSLRFREVANMVGLTIVLLLMAFVIGNDIVRFLPG